MMKILHNICQILRKLIATVADDNKSDIRILGGFITEGLVSYFTSKKVKNSNSVSELELDKTQLIEFK